MQNDDNANAIVKLLILWCLVFPFAILFFVAQTHDKVVRVQRDITRLQGDLSGTVINQCRITERSGWFGATREIKEVGCE